MVNFELGMVKIWDGRGGRAPVGTAPGPARHDVVGSA